jgi:hypothetical protein
MIKSAKAVLLVEIERFTQLAVAASISCYQHLQMTENLLIGMLDKVEKQ